MDPPSYNASPLVDAEKGQTTYLTAGSPSAHPGYSTMYPAQSVTTPSDQPRRRSRGRRFCVRLLHILILDLIFCMLLFFAYKDIHRFTRAFKDLFSGGSQDGMDRADIPLPADCVNVAEWEIVDDHPDHPDHHGYRHVAQTNVNLPISSDLLYFFSRGSLSHGVIRFVDSGAENSDVASVDVRFLYNEQNLIDFAKVCHLQKDDSKNGVGIFSPSWVNHPRDHHHRTAFDVVVTLPTSAWIETLETNMPLFVHELEDFRNTIYFSSISLSTTNVPIHAEYLSAAKARLRTTNSNIAGTINATEVIDLNTSNAPINAQLVLTNEDTGSPSRITAHTSNSNVKLDISLASAAKDNKGGVFKVDVTSSNGPLDVQYSAAPVGSKLDFRGTTSNSPARVTTHETFEGTFLLTTGRWFDAAVHVNGNAEDPAGEGRQRRLTTRISQKGRAEGKVVWDSDSGKELGSVQIQTSNSPAHLFV